MDPTYDELNLVDELDIQFKRPLEAATPPKEAPVVQPTPLVQKSSSNWLNKKYLWLASAGILLLILAKK